MDKRKNNHKAWKIIALSLIAAFFLVIIGYFGLIAFIVGDDLVAEMKAQKLRDEICQEGREIVAEFLNENRPGATLLSLYTEYAPSDYEPLVYDVVKGRFKYEGKEYLIACNVTDHSIYTNEKEDMLKAYIAEEIQKKSFIPDTKVELVSIDLSFPIITKTYLYDNETTSEQNVFSGWEYYMPVDYTDEELIEYASGVFNNDKATPRATVSLSYEGDVDTLDNIVDLDKIAGNSIEFQVNCSNGDFEAYNTKKDEKKVVSVKLTYQREYEVDDFVRYVYEEDHGYNYYLDTAEKEISYEENFDTNEFSLEYSSEENVFAVLNLPKNCFANVYIKDTKDIDRVYYKYWANDKEIYCDIVYCGDGWYEIKSEELEWIFNDKPIVFYL